MRFGVREEEILSNYRETFYTFTPKFGSVLKFVVPECITKIMTSILRLLALTLILFWNLPASARVPTVELISLPGTDARASEFRRTTLPIVMDFLTQWSQVEPLPEKLKIVFSSYTLEINRDLYTNLFGPEYEQKARDFLRRLETKNLAPADWESLLSDYSCQFPTLGLRNKIRITSDRNLILGLSHEFVRGRMLEDLNALLSPETPPNRVVPLFNKTGATTFTNFSRNCRILVFGRMPVAGGANSEASLQTVLHELSHWIDHTTRTDRPLAHPPQGFEEAFADTLATLYLQNPCYKTVADDFLNRCSRDFTTRSSFSESRLADTSAENKYNRGQALRYLVWPQIQSQSITSMGRKLLLARDHALEKATPIQIRDIEKNGRLVRLPTEREEDFSIMEAFTEKVLQ